MGYVLQLELCTYNISCYASARAPRDVDTSVTSRSPISLYCKRYAACQGFRELRHYKNATFWPLYLQTFRCLLYRRSRTDKLFIAAAMPSRFSAGSLREKEKEHITHVNENRQTSANDPDAEFGGTEARKALERKLLLKVDLRMSILIVIYVLNYVSTHLLHDVTLQSFPIYNLHHQIDRNNAGWD